MLGSIAKILRVSCDELLNPEKTLERLANPEPQKEALPKKSTHGS